MDEIVWYIDPVAALLLGVYAIGLIVYLSIPFLRIRIVERKPLDTVVTKRDTSRTVKPEETRP